MFKVKGFIVILVILVSSMRFADAADDLVTKQSMHPFAETLDRLEAAAKVNGLIVFARLDHAAAAKSVGLTMPPATVLVVGNPRSGTPLFLQHPTMAIDLPLKMLVWQDRTGEVYVSYNTAAFITAMLARHGFNASDNSLIADAKAIEAKEEAVVEALRNSFAEPSVFGLRVALRIVAAGRRGLASGSAPRRVWPDCDRCPTTGITETGAEWPDHFAASV